MAAIRSFALFLSLALCAFAGATTAVIDNPPLIETDLSIRGLQAADFNGDTKADIAVLEWAWGAGAKLCVYAGNGDGTFDEPVCTTMTAPDTSSPMLLQVGLIDGDAALDALVVKASSGGAGVAQVYHGNGDGTFGTLGAEVATPSCPYRQPLALAEMTGDSLPDLVLCNATVRINLGAGAFGAAIGTAQPSSDKVLILDSNNDGKRDVVLGNVLFRGNGNGTLQGPVYFYFGGAQAAADLNGDGRDDLIGGASGLQLGLADATGTYPAATTHEYTRGVSVATPDLNGDGRPDVVVAGYAHVSTWLMGAGGVPGPKKTYASASTGAYIATADFDQDGSADVLVGGESDWYTDREIVTLLRGSASGALQSMRAYTVWKTGPYGPVGGKPRASALGDVTGDGHADLIAAAADIRSIAVFSGNGDGTFSETAQYTSVPQFPQYAADVPHFGDFNGDGMLDVLVDRCYLAAGNGTFVEAGAVQSEGFGHVGDFNGDGHLDWALYYAGTLYFQAGNGDGTFDAPTTSNPQSPWGSFAAGDVNNDGRDDAIWGGVVMLGQADGTFVRSQYDFYTLGDIPVLVVDLDADGNLDLVFVQDATGVENDEVTVRMGNGDATFDPGRVITTSDDRPGAYLGSAASGDFDGDGNLDIAFGSVLLLGDGMGSFARYLRFRDFAAGGTLAIANVDGNATDDLIYTSPDEHTVTVLRTATAASLDVPLSITIDSAPATKPAAEEFTVSVHATGLTTNFPTGAVTFTIGGVIAGSIELHGGAGTAVIAASAIGDQQLEAHYGGDDVYAASAMATWPMTITRAVPWFDFGVMPGAYITTIDQVRVQGRVVSSYIATTGTVTVFLDDVARPTQNAPAYDFNLGYLSRGTHRLRLEYSGDASHTPASWGPASIFVSRVPAPMNVTIDPAGGAVVGTAVTITVTFPNPQPANGGIEIRAADGITIPGTIVNGVATITTSALPPSTSFVVFYPGGDQYQPTLKTVSYTVSDGPPATGPASLYLVTPCRVLDTRDPSSPIASGVKRDIFIARHCGIPAGAKAVAANVIIVNPQATGYLTLYPAGSALPPTSSLNYRTNKTRANNGVFPLSAGGMLAIYNSGPASAHVVVDVTGYFQ